MVTHFGLIKSRVSLCPGLPEICVTLHQLPEYDGPFHFSEVIWAG